MGEFLVKSCALAIFRLAKKVWRNLNVNFINLLRTNFCTKVVFSSYVWLSANNSYGKCAQKTLMKLIAGVNFTNIFAPLFSREQD